MTLYQSAAGWMVMAAPYAPIHRVDLDQGSEMSKRQFFPVQRGCRTIPEAEADMTNMKRNQPAAHEAVTWLDGMARTAQSQLKVAAAIPQAIIEANWAMASEFLIFASRRLQAQADLWWSLGDCQELSEAVSIQRQFTERVTEDYSAGVNQLSKVVRRNVDSLSTAGAKLVVEAGDKGQLAA